MIGDDKVSKSLSVNTITFTQFPQAHKYTPQLSVSAIEKNYIVNEGKNKTMFSYLNKFKGKIRWRHHRYVHLIIFGNSII